MKNFLLVGCTGVGKSSFINNAFGEYIAATSPYEACTKLVEHYVQNSPWGNICLIDTPGLAEGDRESDEIYLRLVKSKVALNQLYAILYVTRLDETRFRPTEEQTIFLLNKELGSHIWSRAYLVLTFASTVSSGEHHKKARKRFDQVNDFVKSIAGKSFSGFEGYCMIDNYTNVFPDGDHPLAMLGSV